MNKKFNDTGLCIPDRHYMADTSRKIVQIVRLVEEGEYFTISRPRQFGKTTILSLLAKQLSQREDYVALKISFEGIGDALFAREQNFCPALLRLISRSVQFTNPEMAEYLTISVRTRNTGRRISLFRISGYLPYGYDEVSGVRGFWINNIPVHENADTRMLGYAALHPSYIFGILIFGEPLGLSPDYS